MDTVDWRVVLEVLWDGPPSSLPPPDTIRGLVDFDTETSGLHPDDGGRVSVVSVAWIDWTGGADGREVIRYAAWPFAQGKNGKPEDDGQRDLFTGGQDGEGDVNLDWQEWATLCHWLQQAGDGLSGHNVKFDVPMMRVGVQGLRKDAAGPEWGGTELAGRIAFDTQVATKELWPLQPTALKGPNSVSNRLFGYEDREKQALGPHLGPKENPRYDLVPWDVMYPYAAKDAALACRVRMLELEAIGRGEVAAGGPWSGWARVQRELQVGQVLMAMERRGVPYDAAASQQTVAELNERQAAVQGEIPYDVRAAKRYYFERDATGLGVLVPGARKGDWVKGLALEPYSVTEVKRQAQMTTETLDDMVRDEVPYAEQLRDHHKLGTAISKWYGPYAAGIGGDGRLRCVFRQVASGFEGEGGTASGRFSVERVNLQAIPHDYRLGGEVGALHGLPTPRQLIGQAVANLNNNRGRARRWHLWEFDLAQAELRVAAMWAECKAMLAAIEARADLHGQTAQALFGVTKGDDKWFDLRQVAKRGNFSLIFGSGWLTFQKMVKKETGMRLSDSEAQRIVSEWNQLYPEFRRAIDRHSRRVDFATPGAKGMPLVNGRVRWFRGFEDTHKAFNQRVQASLAELGKDWMLATEPLGQEWELDRRGRSGGVGPGGLLLTIHDSQLWLLPERGGDAMAEQITAAGVACWQAMFPTVLGGVDAKLWDAA